MTAATYDELLAAGHRYLDALSARDPGAAGLAPDCRFTENCLDLVIGGGLWKSASGAPYRQLFADTESGNVGIFATIDEDGVLATFGGRLLVRNGAITELETIVTREGESSIFAPQTLVTPNPIWDEPVDAPASRDAMVAAVDAYFEALETDRPGAVRLHPDCQRVENGAQTTSTPRTGNLSAMEQIEKGQFKYIRELRERRFPLVDVERGLVLAMAYLDVPGDVASIEIDGRVRELPPIMRQPRSTLLFELFKVIDGGQLRWIEAMMVNRPFGTRSGWG